MPSIIVLDSISPDGLALLDAAAAQGITYEVPEIRQLGAYAVVDHAARFEYDGHVGYGLYEHSFSGAMPKYGLE